MKTDFPHPVWPQTIAEWGSIGSSIEGRDEAAILNVELCVHDDVEIDVQNAGGLRFFADLNGNPLASVLNPATGRHRWCGGPATGHASRLETGPGIRRPTRDPSRLRPPQDVASSRRRSASGPRPTAGKPSSLGCKAGLGCPLCRPQLSQF